MSDERETISVKGTAGVLSVTRLGPRSSHLVVDGFIDDALAHAMMQEGDRIVRVGAAVAFHDWWAVQGYSSTARTTLTSWMLRNRHAFDSVHVLVNSGLVAMGVTVANVALGGFLRASRDKAAFDALVDEHAQRRG